VNKTVARMMWILIFPLMLVGCGPSGRSPLGQVEGTVTLDGITLTDGTILFESSDSRPANGIIVDGKITEVTTYETGDGVPIGMQKVAIFATGEADSAVVADPGQETGTGPNYMGAETPSLIPERYRNPATSELTVDVKAGTNSVSFDLKSE